MLNSTVAPIQISRTPAVDGLRGLALFGICVVNVPFMAQSPEQILVSQSGIDGLVQFAVEWLFQGKFFLLFSFLFGWGFAVQMATSRLGMSPRTRFLRRLFGLALIGLVHAILVFFGDILVLYALLGLPLLLLAKATARVLVTIAVALLPVAALSLCLLAPVLPDLAAATALADGTRGYSGGFLDAVQQRVNDWPESFAFNLFFNGPLAFAAFCAGLAAAKTGFFEPGNAVYLGLKKRVWLLLIFGLGGNALFALGTHGQLGDGLISLAAFAGLAVFGPCLTAVYLITAVEASRRTLFRGPTVAAGRMSLTVYILEGILAGLVFNGYGLGLYGQVGATGCFLIAALIYGCTHLFADVWFRVFEIGPLEYLLRRITNGPAASAPPRRAGLGP